jgi:3-hydroxyisobutyrate dehydrogenase-like beta-hydroxyacid dehydrogenase
MKDTVAVLGTGKMGTALVRAFAAAGHNVVAWNRTSAKAEPLRTVATLASTPATAARDASLLVASLTDYGSAIDLTVDAAKPMLEGRDYTGDQCSLDTHLGALAHIVSLSHEAGLDNRFPDTLYAMYAAAVAAGLGAKELPAVYELLRAKRT